MTILNEKINNLDAQQIIDALRGLSNKFDDASMAVYDVMIDVLESKIPEDKFIKICDAL